jgi:hypothetical protein
LPFGFGPKGEKNASMCFLMVFGVTIQLDDESPCRSQKMMVELKKRKKRKRKKMMRKRTLEGTMN